MADFADQASYLEQMHRDNALANREPFVLPKGVEGECETCARHSMRLIDAMCAPCRDRYNPRAL